MHARRRLLNLIVAIVAAMAAVFAWTAPGRAEPPLDHPRHARAAAAAPTMPGQDAFGAIQEIVGILEADPKTDWSKIDLAALREHLIDMNEVTLKAAAAERIVENGLQIDVTGVGRTLDAVRRMLPAHGRALNELAIWHAKTEALANGARLTVTAKPPEEVTRIRGLSFIGLMVSGSHHQLHHLAIARGEHVH